MAGDLGIASKVVDRGVGAVDHHEVGAGAESGFEEFGETGVPDPGLFYEGEYLGLSVSNGSCCGVCWHTCFVLEYKVPDAGRLWSFLKGCRG